jgi:hypothetical protein
LKLTGGITLTDGIAELRGRVAALDSAFTSENESTPPGRRKIICDAEKFIGVLDGVTSTGDHSRTPVVTAADADAVVSACQLIHRLGVAEPELVTEGIAGHQQYWVSTGKPP